MKKEDVEYYITSIRNGSVSGDGVHIRNVVKESKFLYKNSRLLGLYSLLILKRKNKKIVRESLDLLFFAAIVPKFFLAIILNRSVVEINGSIVDEKEWNWIKYAQNKLINSAKKTVVVSIGLKKRFEELYHLTDKSLLTVVNNGGEEKEVIFPKNIIDTLRMSFVGANTSWQDMDTVLSNLLEVETSLNFKIHLTIAGPGFEDFEEIKVGNLKVDFHGKVDSQRAEEIYRTSHVLLCPDKRVFEGYLLSSPIKVYECLNMGILTTFFHQWSHIEEFGYGQTSIVPWDDIFDINLLNEKLKAIRINGVNKRTWVDVVNDLNEVLKFD